MTGGCSVWSSLREMVVQKSPWLDPVVGPMDVRC
jgi:hypothetical protein